MHGIVIGKQLISHELELKFFKDLVNNCVWGIYFDKTNRDDQIPSSRVLRTDISCRSPVAGEQEQEYYARPQIYHPRGRPPTRSIKLFLLEVEVGRPGQ